MKRWFRSSGISQRYAPPYVRAAELYVSLNLMKKKLTLSVDTKKVALLRKAGVRRSKTISALVEELADELSKEETATPLAWLDDWAKALKGKYSKKDLEGDPRFAYAMGHKSKARK